MSSNQVCPLTRNIMYISLLLHCSRMVVTRLSMYSSRFSSNCFTSVCSSNCTENIAFIYNTTGGWGFVRCYLQYMGWGLLTVIYNTGGGGLLAVIYNTGGGGGLLAFIYNTGVGLLAVIYNTGGGVC